MGVSSSALKLEKFTFSSKDDRLVKQSKNFELYHALIKMGFESDSVLKACEKFKSANDLDRAINFLLSQQQHAHVQVHTERTTVTMMDDDAEVDEDGYIKMKCEISTNEGQGCTDRERESSQSVSTSCHINDEVIRFHLDLHKESIEEQRIINKMAEEYEQRQIYKEMMKKEEEEYIKQCLVNIQCNLQYLQSAFYAQSQCLHQQYQNKIAQDTDGQNKETITADFQRQMEILKNNYLQQRSFLDKNMYEMQKMFNQKYGNNESVDDHDSSPENANDNE